MASAVRRWGPLVLWMCAIFIVSSWRLPQAAAEDRCQIAHLLEYGILGALSFRAFAGERISSVADRTLIAALFLALAYAGSDEYHQSFVPGRSMDIIDWVFDAIGASMGVLTYKYLFISRRKVSQ